jgi:hypothetical protein
MKQGQIKGKTVRRKKKNNLVSAIVKKVAFFTMIIIAFTIANMGKLGVVSVTTEMSVNSSMNVIEGDRSTVGGIASHSISSGIEGILQIVGYTLMAVSILALIIDIVIDAKRFASKYINGGSL